ncbi:LuxR family transcriptional regulator [Streptomyces sp. NPDC094447]|uniref:LuxR family transcriptional regulator n=1 Tax=Streptomyces sp. NPDC094447 TaxID=3366062 RepID=UPI0038227FBE
MVNGRVDSALHRLGVGRDAARVYQAMLDLAPAPLSTIGAAIGLAGRELISVHEELAEAGLAEPATGEHDIVAPVPPSAGLQILGRQRAAELEADRIAVSGAFAAFRRQRLSARHDDLLEVVTGDDIGPRIRQAWASAQTRIRQLDSPPYFPLADGTNDALTTLERGVSQQVVYCRDSLEHPGNLDNIEPCVAAGEQARVLPEVPVKLLLIDDAYALVSASIRDAEVHNTMLIVQPCALFASLVALFEQTWRLALPFQRRTPRPQRLLPADRRLLALLVGGVPDDDIAQRLGVSRRTFFRRLDALMARVGATTRFQLALQAQSRGWL